MISHAFVCIGDTHLGLKTDGIDRRDEIFKIFETAIAEAQMLKRNGYETRLILGGDIFDDHDPGEDLIALFIKILGLIKAAEIKTEVMVGNHEAVPDPKRLSCLSFLREIKVGYPMVTLRETPKTIPLIKNQLYMTFLPHVTRAALKSLGVEGTTQDFIDAYGRDVNEKIGAGKTHLVFSHLNVRQSKSGSEANLLKKSEAFLPMAFVNTPPGFTEPAIVNFHIHERQVVGNVHIVGSPLYCSFGETQEKTFTTVVIQDGAHDTEVTFVEKETPFTPFYQTEVEMIGETVDFFEQPVIAAFLNEVTEKQRECVVKIGVTISAENNSYDWAQIRHKISQMFYPEIPVNVLPIDVRVVQKRVVRNIKQKPDLDPDAAVKVYLKANLKNDMDRAKRIYRKAKNYLGVN